MAFPTDRVSLLALQNMLAQTAGEAFLPTIKIAHFSFLQPLYFIADTIDLTARYTDNLLSQAMSDTNVAGEWVAYNQTSGIVTSTTTPPGVSRSIRVRANHSTYDKSGVYANLAKLRPYEKGAEKAVAVARVNFTTGRTFEFGFRLKRRDGEYIDGPMTTFVAKSGWESIRAEMELPDARDDDIEYIGVQLYSSMPVGTSLAYFYFASINLSLDGKFIAYPFEAMWPDDREDQLPTVTLTIGNVDRRIIPALRGITPPPPLVTMGMLMRSDPDNPAVVPLDFRMEGFDYDAASITATLAYQFKISSKYPRFTINPATCPGLF